MPSFAFTLNAPGSRCRRSWDRHVESWLGLLEKTGRFRDLEGTASILDDMTARDYADSDRPDLVRLSRGQEPEQK